MKKAMKKSSTLLLLSIFMKWALFLLAIFLPEIASAADSQPIDLNPPPSDVSITYLTNVFGTVEGVLSGGGSQIVGQMFAIFNSAVLSLGGMIMMYTIIVGTVNTAGDGQVLGKNWSSIWIPVRTTLGISLLFTYTSGYNVLQVFIMWVVVQGVGAADLIWDAALNYLKSGGVIVQPLKQSSSTDSDNNYEILQGASTILAGQTCMAAMQLQLNAIQDKYLNDTASPCSQLPSGTPDDSWSADETNNYLLCNTTVPDFLSSVDIMAAQDEAVKNSINGGSAPQPYVLMPNFTEESGYSNLNGACGMISWALLNGTNNTRATAVNEMYTVLMSVAQTIAQNDTTLSSVSNNQSTASSISSALDNAGAVFVGSVGTYFSSTGFTAQSPLGVPGPAIGSYKSGCIPTPNRVNSCSQWDSPSEIASPLLNGTELEGAVNDYNSIMEPYLNRNQAADVGNLKELAEMSVDLLFIGPAEARGWITAGSWFFAMANANDKNQNVGVVDTTSNITQSEFPPGATSMTLFCTSGVVSNANGTNLPEVGLQTTTVPIPASTSYPLCTWYGGGQTSRVTNQPIPNQVIPYLMAGPTANVSSTASMPQQSSSGLPPMYTNELNATVYGYIDNASNIVVHGQGNTQPPLFLPRLGFASFNQQTVPNASCRPSGIFGLAGDICQAVVNGAIIPIMNAFINAAMDAMAMCIDLIFLLPVMLFSLMFVRASRIMAQTNLNPLLALAQIGNMFIDVCMTVWLAMSTAMGLVAIIPLAIGPIIVFFIIIGPLIISWLSVIWGLGIIAAYYVPMLPYMIFTFGSFGWLVGVVEAMVAAPIVALGVSLPEGQHDVFGKGLDSIMLIFGAFLRPSMMIIGYIIGIILSTVGIWMIDGGFTRFELSLLHRTTYTMWTGLFANFFLFGTYMTMCITIIEKSFELIYKLPDGVLRWIGGGMQGAFGESTAAAEGAQAVKKQTENSGEALKAGASAERDFSAAAKGMEGMGGAKGGGGPSLHVGQS